MTDMKRLSMIWASLWMTCAVAFAQANITVQVPSVVSLDEQFRLVFLIEGERASDFQWPGTEDFTVQWGPQSGSSSQTSIINGKVSKSVSTSYTYVLMPVREGVFTIPSCSVKVKGKTLYSDPVSVRVGKAQSTSSSGEDLFMTLSLDKTEVVLGEPVTATLKLYTKVPIAGFEDVKFPSFDGFWTQITESPNTVEFHRESLNGEVYDASVLRRYSIVPQKAGDLVIDPAQMVCLVQVKNRNSSTGSIFDSFFQSDYSTVRKRISTAAVTLKVRALPQGAPESFCGGVGKFNIAVMLSKDSLRVHDAASLILKVKGEGNLNMLEAPKIKFPSDFEIYDVKTSDDGNIRSFEYPFIPRHHGDYSIGPVEFSYYDIESNSYKTISTQALDVQVEKSLVSDSQTVSTPFVGVVGKDVKNLGSDIRYICVTKPNLKKSGDLFVNSLLFPLLIAFLILSAIVLYVLITAFRKRRSDVLSDRKRKASKAVKKKLARSASYLEDGLYGAFYEELHKALLGFVTDKLSMETFSPDKENIAQALKDNGLDQALVSEYLELLNACEYARYSPQQESAQMREHYKKALDIISLMDESMNKHKKVSANSLATLLTLLFLGLPTISQASPQEQDCIQLWESGIAAYSAGEWEEAYEDWYKIYESGQRSPQLCYNLGCASFKSSHLSESVLFFERALKLDPNYEDARHNLDYVGQFLLDRIDRVPEFFLLSWINAATNALGSDAWAVISLLFCVLCLACVLYFLLTHSRKARIWSASLAVLTLLCFAFSLSFSISSKNRVLDESEAVIMSAVSVVRSSPDDKSGTELFVLHEGTKVKILESVGEWDKIELQDGRQGWSKKSNLEII